MPDPITAVVIKGQGTGDGSVPLADGMVARTPSPLSPDIVVRTISPMVAIAIRFANTFLVLFFGLLVASMSPEGKEHLYTHDFLHLLRTCASLALPGAVLGLVKDLVTIFGRLEQTHPLMSGNV